MMEQLREGNVIISLEIRVANHVNQHVYVFMQIYTDGPKPLFQVTLVQAFIHLLLLKNNKKTASICC